MDEPKPSKSVTSGITPEQLGTLSHEFRTPLNGVLGMARLLESTKLTDEQRAYVGALKQSGDHLLSLVNDVLDLTIEVPVELAEHLVAVLGVEALERGDRVELRGFGAFSVRKRDARLAANLTAGLEKMVADGSFDKLFQEHFGEQIRQAALKERRIIDLDNPMAPSLPLERKELWFH